MECWVYRELMHVCLDSDPQPQKPTDSTRVWLMRVAPGAAVPLGVLPFVALCYFGCSSRNTQPWRARDVPCARSLALRRECGLGGSVAGTCDSYQSLWDSMEPRHLAFALVLISFCFPDLSVILVPHGHAACVSVYRSHHLYSSAVGCSAPGFPFRSPSGKWYQVGALQMNFLFTLCFKSFHFRNHLIVHPFLAERRTNGCGFPY